MSMSRYLVQAYEVLSKANIDTPEYRSMLASHPNPLQTAFAFKILVESGLFNPSHRAAILNHAQPQRLAMSLKQLKSANLIDLGIHLEGLHVEYLANIFIHLAQAKLLEPKLIPILVNHHEVQSLAFAIANLKQFWILNRETLDLILSHPHPQGLANGLTHLARVDLLNPQNQSLLLKHFYPNILIFLYQADLLTQENFEQVLSPEYAFIRSPEAINLLWHEWPNELIHHNWPRILEAAGSADPLAAMRDLTATVFNPPQAATQLELNSSQSTHTASIHESAVQSVLNLQKNYPRVEFDVEDIKTSIQKLMPNPKNEAALRFLERLSVSQTRFCQEVNLHLGDLVCLCFTALHDASRRQGNLEQALTCLVEGLYEIQRGYNLDARGNDRGGRDKSICVTGSFHKIMEKLVGIHPDVELKFINDSLVAIKFPIIVNEVASEYLKTLASPYDFKQLALWYACIDKLIHTGMKSIWPQIQAGLIARLMLEFDHFFPSPDSPKLQELLINLPYIKIPDLSQFQAPISQSLAYHDYLKAQMFVNHRLWLDRPKSNKVVESSRVSAKTMLEWS